VCGSRSQCAAGPPTTAVEIERPSAASSPCRQPSSRQDSKLYFSHPPSAHPASPSGNQARATPHTPLHAASRPRRLPDGSAADVTPPPDSGLNVRTRVHEYGGGEHLVLADGRLVFSNFA
jgi:hypothetical protein